MCYWWGLQFPCLNWRFDKQCGFYLWLKCQLHLPLWREHCIAETFETKLFCLCHDNAIVCHSAQLKMLLKGVSLNKAYLNDYKNLQSFADRTVGVIRTFLRGLGDKVQFCGTFWACHFLNKNCFGYFWATLQNLLLFIPTYGHT